MFVKDLRGVVNGLQRVETASGSRYRFSLQVERGQAVLVDCSATMPVGDGETVLVSGPKDTDGMVTADAVTRVVLPPAPLPQPTSRRLPRARLIALALVADVLGLTGAAVYNQSMPISGGGLTVLLLFLSLLIAAILGALGSTEQRTMRIAFSTAAAVLILAAAVFLGIIIKVVRSEKGIYGGATGYSRGINPDGCYKQLSAACKRWGRYARADGESAAG